jgi:hypothetical protein
MATTTYTDNVEILGSRDINQLKVQADAGQTEPLQTWESSAADVLAQVTSDGRLQVGDDVGLASPDALVEVHRADTSTGKPTRGIHSLGQVSGTLAALVQWMVGELELRGSSAIDALHTALRIRASNMNTGTPTANAELRAADIEAINDSSAGSSALPRATGLQVAVTNAAGKTITNAAALRLKMSNDGTITNPYSIFAEGPGVAHFEDYLEMKRPTAVPGTPATDFLRIYAKSDGRLYIKNWNGVEFSLTILQKQVEISFNPLGTRSQVFTIVDADVTPTSRLTAVQSGDAPTGRAQDENEMDALHLRCVAGSGQFTLYADTLFGPVANNYKIDYSIA